MRIDLTSSELMAHYLTIPGHSEVFIDCSQHPSIETTPEQLLLRLMGIRDEQARSGRGR